MALVNENFLELPQDNVFADIRREVEKFKVIHPSYRLIDLSVNDVTHSLGAHVRRRKESRYPQPLLGVGYRL